MQNIQKTKIFVLTLILSFPLCAFAQNGIKRINVSYTQRHSQVAGANLYADGIKIKRDLSLINKAQEDRILSDDKIPADGLYGDVWNNDLVNPYSAGVRENAPDSFRVDLRNFTMPTMGFVTSPFGWRPHFHRVHYGIDLKINVGDTIYAAFDGKIRVCSYERGYGNHVVIRHPNGLETVYGHLSAFLVHDDEVVQSGQPIGLGGSTGFSTGPHLHFELRYLGRPINPTAMIDFVNKVCHRDYYEITPQTFAYAASSVDELRATRVSSRNSRSYASKHGRKNKYVGDEVKYHRVKRGDTMYAIARKYGVSVSKLCALNSLGKRSRLSVGRSIRIS